MVLFVQMPPKLGYYMYVLLLLWPGFEDSQCDNSHLKRKSCRADNESDDSDVSDSEVRQRESVTFSLTASQQ